MLASSPDVLPPDPDPFLGEAPAADPRRISALRPSLRLRSWGRRNRCGAFCPRVEIRSTFLHGDRAASRRYGWISREPCMMTKEGGVLMPRQNAHPRQVHGLSRRELLQAGLAAGITLSAWPLFGPPVLWSEEAAPPKRGGILRV